MSYLNPPYPNNFQELCAAMPLFYLDVFEMRQILRSQGRLLDGACASFEQVIDDNFILKASKETIAIYEKFLELIPDAGMSLDERRKIVIANLYHTTHFGEPEIREIFSIFNKGRITVGFSNGIIALEVYPLENECLNTQAFIMALNRQKPAHLSLAMIYAFSFAIEVGFRIDSWPYRVPECGTIRCGTWWTRHTLGWSERHRLAVSGRAEPFEVSPELSGTLPVIKTPGYSLRAGLRISGRADAHGITPEFAGTLPEESRKGYTLVCGAVRSGGVATAFEGHPKEAGEPEKTGTWPVTATAGRSITMGAVHTGGGAEVFKTAPELAGTLPETAVSGYAITGSLSARSDVEGHKITPEYTGTLPKEAQHGARDD